MRVLVNTLSVNHLSGRHVVYGFLRQIAKRIAGVPTWIFHGDADPVVPVEESRRMAAALKMAGAEVRYDELEGVGHDSWDFAYGLEELPIWMFAKQKQEH